MGGSRMQCKKNAIGRQKQTQKLTQKQTQTQRTSDGQDKDGVEEAAYPSCSRCAYMYVLLPHRKDLSDAVTPPES